MEDFDDPPTSRLQRNLLPVAAATVLAGIGKYLGRGLLANANCPRQRQRHCPAVHRSTHTVPHHQFGLPATNNPAPEPARPPRRVYCPSP